MNRLNATTCRLIALALFCTGCDGTYVYTYQGSLYLPDRTTPAKNIPLQVTANSSTANPNYDSHSDDQGHFSGSFSQSTFWTFFLRPSAPKLKAVYLLTPSNSPIEIPVDSVDQPTTDVGRNIALPPVTLPDNSKNASTHPI
jgi:hypothetical protein